jgi:hypothetical protein
MEAHRCRTPAELQAWAAQWIAQDPVRHTILISALDGMAQAEAFPLALIAARGKSPLGVLLDSPGFGLQVLLPIAAHHWQAVALTRSR